MHDLVHAVEDNHCERPTSARPTSPRQQNEEPVSHVIHLSLPRAQDVPERLEVCATTVDWDKGDAGQDLVQIEHHRGGRYMIIALNPSEARQLAEFLNDASDTLATKGSAS